MRVKHDFDSVEVETPNAASAPVERQAPEARPSRMSSQRLRNGAVTGAVLAAFWQVLHWGDPASWVVGVPSVLGGAAIAAFLPEQPANRIKPGRVLRFTRFAIWGVLRGAVEVGLRSLRPDRLSPGMVHYDTSLPEGPPRRTFALMITLMPGTLTARLDGARLDVHAMALSDATRTELRQLEAEVAALYGLDFAGDLQ
ncbi:MAG: Na+/H+ antiporter subunit E [Pseudomonadota bacterium]